MSDVYYNMLCKLTENGFHPQSPVFRIFCNNVHALVFSDIALFQCVCKKRGLMAVNIISRFSFDIQILY